MTKQLIDHSLAQLVQIRSYKVVAVILLPNIVLWAGIFGVDGIIIQRDFNFPVYNDNFEAAYFPIWNEFTSQTNMERLPRLLMMSPFIMLSYVGIDVSLILKIMILGAFTLITTSTYLFLSSLLRITGRLKNANTSIRLFSLLGAYLFAYNPVNLQFLGGISILVSVGMLPLLLYLVLKAANRNYFSLILPLPLLFSMGHPFTFIMNGMITILFTLVMYHRVFSLRLMALKLATGLAFLSVFVAWIWIPYSSVPITSVDLGRAENLERETFDTVSDNNLYKILLLERDRFIYAATDPQAELSRILHYLSLAFVVAIAFAGFVLRSNRIHKKALILFTGGFVTTTLLALGSGGPLGEPYWRFISESTIGWIFRSPLKFQLYQGFFISTAAVISLVAIREKLISRRFSHRHYGIISPAAVIMIIAGSTGYGIYDASTNSFSPIQLPKEYYEINDLLASRNDGSKVVYYPRYNELPTTWSSGHLVPPFDMKSSKIPTYETSTSYSYVKNAVYDYPYVNGNLGNSEFYEYLSSIGVRYIVFHNDRGYEIDQRNLENMLYSQSLEILYSQNDWYLFEIKDLTPKKIRAVSNIIVVNGTAQAVDISTPSIPTLDSKILGDSTPLGEENILLRISDNDAEIPLSYNILEDPSFSSWNNQTNAGWTTANDDFQVTRYSDQQERGLLELSTSNQDKKLWSGLVSSEIGVRSGAKYLFTINAKTYNAYGSHVKVQGLNGSSAEWQDILFLTGGSNTSSGLSIDTDSDWTLYWKALKIPEDMSKLRYVVNAGTVSDAAKGNASTTIKNPAVFELTTRIPRYDPIVEYVKLSPTKYQVQVNSQEPFFLVFTEAFDRGWIASDAGTEIRSVPLYGMINGFYVERPGNYQLELEYRPQSFFEIGAIISSVATLGITVYLVGFYGKTIRQYFDRLSLQLSPLKRERSSADVNRMPEKGRMHGRDADFVQASRIEDPKRPNLFGISTRTYDHGNQRFQSDIRRNLGRSLVTNITVVLGILFLLCIPFLVLQGQESNYANLAAGFALDFLIVSVLWKSISSRLTPKLT